MSALSILTVLCATAALGQDLTVLQPGSRLRVGVTGESRRVVGTLSELDDEALVLEVKGTPRTFSRNQLSSLAVSVGKNSRRRGALTGAGLGVLVGAIAGFSAGDDTNSDSMVMMTAGGKAAVLGVTLGLLGGLVGLAVPPGEKWEEVSPHKLRVAWHPEVAPGERISLSVSLSF